MLKRSIMPLRIKVTYQVTFTYKNEKKKNNVEFQPIFPIGIMKLQAMHYQRATKNQCENVFLANIKHGMEGSSSRFSDFWPREDMTL